MSSKASVRCLYLPFKNSFSIFPTVSLSILERRPGLFAPGCRSSGRENIRRWGLGGTPKRCCTSLADMPVWRYSRTRAIVGVFHSHRSVLRRFWGVLGAIVAVCVAITSATEPRTLFGRFKNKSHYRLFSCCSHQFECQQLSQIQQRTTP